VDRLLGKGANVNAEGTEYYGSIGGRPSCGGGSASREGGQRQRRGSSYLGRTAPQAASEGGHLAIVDRLLEKGANVDAEAAGVLGNTAMQAASERGHLAVVERLRRDKV